MAKRVSMKGKGADIFFGEYTPVADDTIAAPDTVSTPEASPEESRERAAVADPARKQTRMHACTHAEPESPVALNVSSAQTGILPDNAVAAVWTQLRERATVSNAFRYTDRELTALSDVLYELTKRHGVRLSKQDVARLGLDVVLWDYQQHGDDSMLGAFVLRKKRIDREAS